MSTESNSGGDGILSDQGSQDFGSMIGSTPTQTSATPVQTQTQQTTTPPAQQTNPPTTPGVHEPTQDGSQPQAPAQTQQPTTAAAPAAAPDLTAIIKSTVDATAQAMRQSSGQPQQTQAPAPETAEQFQKRYGIVRPTEAHITALLGQDPKVAAATLAGLLDANITASIRMANDIVEAKLSQMESKYAPIAQGWRAQQEAAANQASESRFYTAFPDLANEKEIVNETRDALIGRGMKFASEQEAFSAVANATRTILKRVGANGTQTQTGQTQQRQSGQQPPSRQMSVASSTGRTGSGQATATEKSVVDEVFGADAR